jgi:hypothetical protein
MIPFQKAFRSILFVGVVTFVASSSQAQDKAPSTTTTQQDMHVGPIKNPPQTAPSFKLTLSAGLRNKNTSEFRVGSNVWITVKMTNTTNHTIDRSGVFYHGVNAFFSYDVKDEDGKQPEKVVHTHPEFDTAEPFWGCLQPRESDLAETDLSLLYKFDRPGKYFIQVSRHDPDFLDDKGEPTIVSSNTITITIAG